uniref:NAC domain-containing protein n=1 Tax=Brassica oleracea var. oleracea TaxID=109376 RepID=A0A0D3EF01_BRAOL
MHKMCHEPINVSPVESGVTFNELDHLPLTARRSLLQPNSVSVPAIVKREEDCFNELGCDAPESVNSQTPESTSIGCSLGLVDSESLRPQNNILLVSCSNNAQESFNRVEQIEETTGSDDALEHLTLNERRKLLLERMVLRLPEPNFLEDNTKDCHETDLFKIKAENTCKNGIASSSAVRFSGFLEKIDSFLYKKVTIGSKSESQLSGVQENDIPIANKRSFELSPEASLSNRDYEHSPLSSNCYASAAEQQRGSVKRVKRNPRPLNVSEIQLNQEKCEPLEDSSVDNNEEPNPVTSEQVQVKREVERHDPASFVKDEASELDEDEIDHMKLIDRLKLRSSSNGSGHHEAPPSSSPPPGFSFCTSDEYVKPARASRSWKRKKTATNSIETALEEDAPGLLQVLIKQGVTVDELRLYGENDSFSDDSSLLEETFSELEDVISQLYFKRATGPKLLNLSFSKDSRTSYCLTCLFSLIEQARYLRFRKWPVEWGWCRDLQSFIFVFERHNRIVMERPEYGYATYFFELSNTASVGWQIKRLVLAMKLASCGRYQLIENKPLLVGEDMTEAEAEVLMKYGWVANTGLGTMLNYRDRVFHDRKSHKETSEWKSKISNLLVDGYNSGTIVSTFIVPPDDVEDDDDAGLDMEQVKLESY